MTKRSGEFAGLSARLRLWFAVLAPLVVPLPAPSFAAESDPAAYCAKAGDDDTVRPPPAVLRAALRSAYRRLLGGTPPDDRFLLANAQIRCMGGKIMACFVGANLPCAKISASRDNRGAAEWCRAHPADKSVPAVATGHDAMYSYGCDAGRARVTGTLWTLDRRGFAERLWTPLN